MPKRQGSRRGRFPYFLARYPETTYWLGAGLMPRSALALTEAGFLSLADLERATREQLLALPNVGPETLDRLEQLLGELLPGARPRPPQVATPSEEVWRQRGLPMAAAITFAMEKMTLARLSSLSRAELLALPFVGAKAVEACERILGRKIPAAHVDPVEAYWRSQGFSVAAAQRLRRAGLASLAGRLCLAGLFHLDDVAPLSQEQFLALPGLGTFTLLRCERLLGRRLPAIGRYWLHRGLPPHAAWKLAMAGINNPAALAAAGNEALRVAGLDEEEIASCRQACRA